MIYTTIESRRFKGKTMSRKNRKYQKDGSVFYMSAEEATLSKMPKYNAYATGHGAHGSKKYDRRATEREFRREHDM